MVSIRNDRLARARAALQSAEVASGVRSLESNSILEASLSPGVYHVHSGVEGVVYSLAQIMTDQMWGAVVGIPDVGWEAASQMGLDLTRVVAVPRLPDAVGKTVGVLIEGFDVVALGDSYVSAPIVERSRPGFEEWIGFCLRRFPGRELAALFLRLEVWMVCQLREFV